MLLNWICESSVSYQPSCIYYSKYKINVRIILYGPEFQRILEFQKSK